MERRIRWVGLLMTDMTYDNILEHAEKLSLIEKARLAEHLMHDVRSGLETGSNSFMDSDDDEPLTLEEIHALLGAGPKTGAEIVASGVVGAWKDMGITDGVDWVNEQKRKRSERRKWQMD